MQRDNKKSAISRMVALVAAALLLFSATSAWAEIGTLSSAINKAGRQHMLTQRMVKAYLLVGMGVQSARHKRKLSDAVALFETQLAELKVFAPNDDVRDGLSKVEELWAPFKQIVSDKVTKQNANLLLETNDGLLAAAHAVVGMLEKESKTTVGQLVNLAGRQRMLSQRLSKFYMAQAWGIERPEMVAEMRLAATQFESVLMNELFTSTQNTPEIQKELKKAIKQWEVYKRGLRLEEDSDDYIPVIMAATSENLLKSMNTITGMYEKISAD